MTIDFKAVALKNELKSMGSVIDAASIPIIDDKYCCGWCDPWKGSCTDTKHGFCPKLQRMTSRIMFVICGKKIKWIL